MLLETKLPKGYEPWEMYLRKWLLDHRLRMKAQPMERDKKLRALIKSYTKSNGRNIDAGKIRFDNRANGARSLAEALKPRASVRNSVYR